MAIVQDTETQEKEETGLDQPKLGGEQAAELSQGVAAGTQAQKAGPTTDRRGSGIGSRISNLKKYVEANRGAGMAGKIQSGMEDIRKDVSTGLTEAQTGLEQQAAGEKARLTKGEQLIQESQAGGGGLFEAGRSAAFTQDISPATPAPQQQLGTGTDGAAPQPEVPAIPDFSQYGATAAERLGEFGRYKGGEVEQLGITDEQKLQQNIANLQKRANLAQTEKGRFELLREQFGRPGYTTGQQRLDQLILQAAPEESAVLREMATGIADPVQQQMIELQAKRDTEQGLIGTQAQQLATGIKTGLFGEAGQPVIDPATGQVTDVGGVLGEFRTGLEERVGAEQARSAEQFEAIRNIVERGYDISPQMLADIGVTDPGQQEQFLDYYGRGQGRTLGTAATQGGFDLDELAAITQKLQAAGQDVDYNTVKEMYTGTPISLQDFSARAGKDYNAASAENKATLQNQYEQYKNNLAAQSADYRANLEGFVGENLGDLRVKGPEVDYSQYLNQLDPNRITAAKVASAEDFARQAALEQLAGLGFGPLQQGQIGEAGTAGDLGYGQFDIGSALGAGRNLYELPTYTDFGSVGVPGVESDLTLGEKAQRETEAGTQLISDTLADIDPVTGQIAQSAMYDPLKATVDQSVKGITTPMTDAELSAKALLEGDVMGAGNQVAFTPTIAATEAASAPVVGAEKLLTGGDRYGGAVDDYTQSLRDLSAADFNTIDDSIKTTYKMPEQMTRDAVAKVDKVISEASQAVSNSWKSVKKVFCFVAGSVVKMADGSEKLIENVMPGENIFGGGRVDIVGKALSDNIHNYDGTEVSGSHPVFEAGSWKRVEDANLAEKLDKYTEPVLVYTMVTENHIMVVGNNVYTDFVEYDGSSLDSYEEVIENLNKDTGFVEKVQEMLDEQLYSKAV